MLSNNNEKRLTTYASLLQNIRGDKDVSSLYEVKIAGPHVSVYKKHTEGINKIHSKYKNSEGKHSEKEQKHLNALLVHHSELSKFHRGLASVHGFIGDKEKSGEHNTIAAQHEGLSGKVNPGRSLASQKKGIFHKANHAEVAKKISDITERGHNALK